MKKVIFTSEAPAPIGPYSQAILNGDTLYASGQIAIDPLSGLLVQGDIQLETHQVMKNIEAVLQAASMNFSNIVKTTIFIKNMGQFSEINEVYGLYFPKDYAPARETVEVSELPKSVNIEISFIAIK
ncbi:RidA family protein [Flavobacteriaceae bacterium]|nr:RidA family protein [Flavobacteriaceae bacterium]